jgi:predicted membrane chloride channel (bestrophin family)
MSVIETDPLNSIIALSALLKNPYDSFDLITWKSLALQRGEYLKHYAMMNHELQEELKDIHLIPKKTLDTLIKREKAKILARVKQRACKLSFLISPKEWRNVYVHEYSLKTIEEKIEFWTTIIKKCKRIQSKPDPPIVTIDRFFDSLQD